MARRFSTSGLFFALLALTAQLAFGAVVPRPEVARVVDGAGIICHSPSSDAPAPPPPAHHHTPDCLLCPLCTSLATPGIVMPAAGEPILPPRAVAFHRPGLPPPATAPPPPALLVAQPRGPPALLA